MTWRKRFRTDASLIELILVACALTVLLYVAWPYLEERMQTMRDRALITAARDGDWDRVVTLIKRGATPDGLSGESPHYCLLCEAIRQNRPDLAEAILANERASRVRYLENTHGAWPAICYAVRLRRLAIATVLLRHGADANTRWRDSMTPLHHAAENGDRAMVNLLLTHGASAGAETRGGVTPKDLAYWEGYTELADRLEQAGVEELRAARSAGVAVGVDGGPDYD